MSKKKKLLEKALNDSGSLKFEEFKTLCEYVGMKLDRVKGSHHLYTYSKLGKNLTFPIQTGKNGEAKRYQVNQLINFIDEYDMETGE